MKNSKIFDIIKKSGRAFVFPFVGEQWLSDGAAAYSLAGLPEFSEETLLCMFDKTKEDGFYIDMNAKAVLNEDGEEFDAEFSKIVIKRRKMDYLFVKFDQVHGFFVDYRYIKDFLGDYNTIFKVRCTQKNMFLMVFDGFVPVAAIAPASTIDIELQEEMYDILSMMNRRIEKEARDSFHVEERGLIKQWYDDVEDAEQIEM